MTILEAREQRGIEKGLLEGKRNTAKNMLFNGEPIEKIIKYTGLEIKEIEKLKGEIRK